MSLYCYDERHDEPCPQPCAACADECDEGSIRTEQEEEMARAMDYDPSTQRDEDGPWGGGFARNH